MRQKQYNGKTKSTSKKQIERVITIQANISISILKFFGVSNEERDYSLNNPRDQAFGKIRETP